MRIAVAALLLAACAQVDKPGLPDLNVTDASSRVHDIADVDLIQIEVPDQGMCGDCDDQIACTIDTCLPTAMCNHVPDHGKCADRQLCTGTGCIAVDESKICAFCTTDADCGLDELCTSLPSGDAGTQQFCLPRCGAGGACPKGFACDTQRSRCVPDSDSGLCCYDGDGDDHGIGAGCLGTDCNDSDPTVYAGHPEICDGKDNDCNGQVDDGYLCGGPTCTGTGPYVSTPIPQCTNGACTTPAAVSCGRYTCMDVTTPVDGNVCRTSCSDDTSCTSGSYCDGAACNVKIVDGGTCTRNGMCAGGHCQNGHCCASGDCCAVANDCPVATYASAATCDAPATACQGHRGTPSCNAQSECAKVNVDDDSACTSSTSINCGTLNPQSCNGTAMQAPLSCPTTCGSDGDCVSSAYCSGTTCVSRKPDGSACTATDQCAQGHGCLNGFCCNASTGSCCGVASDCPASFGAAATCDNPLTSCQGHRIDKTCTASVCGSSNVTDDSACTSSVTKSCGAYASVSCTGAATQSPLACATSCTVDANCAQPADHCVNGTCQPYVMNGGSCSMSMQCTSNACVSGTCCSTACNSTTCDTCGGGTCMPFSDPYEDGNTCLPSLPDLGSGAFTASVTAYLQSSTDTDDWYQFYATDSSTNACNGYIRVQLAVPTGTDYDVYLYGSSDGSCGAATLLADGISSTGNEDVKWTERCNVSDTGWYLVDVHMYAGSSCTLPYTLTVDARL